MKEFLEPTEVNVPICCYDCVIRPTNESFFVEEDKYYKGRYHLYTISKCPRCGREYRIGITTFVYVSENFQGDYFLF